MKTVCRVGFTNPTRTIAQDWKTHPSMPHQHEFDVLILGSGAAGLTLALRLAESARVAVFSKNTVDDGSTPWAQGGIAAVLNEDDSVDAHIQDTETAGAGLCEKEAVRFTAEHGTEAVRWLESLGMDFTRQPREDDDDAPLHLTREGGHSHRRIAHAADATGRALEDTLATRARRHPNITLFEHHIAVDLITAQGVERTAPRSTATDRCLGAYVLNRRAQRVDTFRAPQTVLATGGAAKVYLYTSNPDTATGDGIAMAWRAGCRVGNMEFIQFHPTCLFEPRAKSFLVSEAVRGEGGRLLLPDGTPFMHRFDERAELAPRDIVARAIDHEIKRLGVDCVYLDISHKPADFIRSHFPNIFERCLEFGYDMTQEPLPVVPAAHYTCGGVMVDNHGRTDLDGLYAVGEVTYTGLHGANRLASNSLLECVVYGEAAAEDIRQRLGEAPAMPAIPQWDESQVTDSDEEVVVSHNWHELRQFMWDYVGIVRSTKRLERAKRRVDMLRQEIQDYYSHFRVTNNLLELRNLALVADLIIRSAMTRHESRGLHYVIDFPETNPELDHQPTILAPENRS
mgnify:CR=1 FL=1